MTITPTTPLDLDQLQAGFADPPAGTAPMMRWWWFGPTIERAELDRELTAMAAAGISGVEVAYVYPLAPATSSFADDTFLADLRFAAERARELGLRFDLTLGSGWSFGGPHIDDHLAAQCLDWERREIPPGAIDLSVEPRWPGEQVLAAYLGDGSIQEQPDDFVRLEVRDGVLRVPQGIGPRQLLLARSRPTGQNVKRAAAGAEGPVLDHYSAEATRVHLSAIGDRLLDAVPAELAGSVFCDSLEVYESDWTPSMCEEFERRRGYALLPVLHLLAVDVASASSVRVRRDYHRTLLELYEENFVAVVQRWASGRGVPFRIQGYGTPPAAVSSYRFADLIEGEGWGWTKITQTRWASSAAHLYRRPITSAESWTWVHSPSFRATPLDLKGEAHEHLLNGVNLLIGHGWPYSPVDAPGLGWFFYAAGALNDRNPWWPVMGELTRYLGRLCWLLQQGEPVADVALYVPNDDLLAGMGRQQGGSLDLWRETGQLIGESVPAAIRRAGYDYDLVDDEALRVVAAGRYPVVILPGTRTLPSSTRAWLSEVITNGGTVILVDSPVEIAGAQQSSRGELMAALRATLTPDLELPAGTDDIGFVHRRCGDSDVYVVANTGPAQLSFTAKARTAAAYVDRWDPLTGQVVERRLATDLRLELEPYAATVLTFHDQESGRTSERGAAAAVRKLGTGWTVRFNQEPERSVELPHVWEDEPGRRHYSGSAVYRTTLSLAADDLSRPLLIDLGAGTHTDAGLGTEGDMVGPSYRVRYRGPVGEVAQLRLNGIDCGSVWAPPYRVDVSDAARPGPNDLEIVVFNTAANTLAVDHHIVELAQASEERYGRRFRMQELDRAMESVRSGLLDVPTLIIG